MQTTSLSHSLNEVLNNLFKYLMQLKLVPFHDYMTRHPTDSLGGPNSANAPTPDGQNVSIQTFVTHFIHNV